MNRALTFNPQIARSASVALRPLPALQPVAHPDTAVILYVLMPAVLAAGLCYLGGAIPAGLVVLGAAFVIGGLAAPQIMIYLYFLMLALDQLFVEDATAVFSPSKAIGPAALAFYIVRLDRSPERLRVTRPFVVLMLAFGLYGFLISVVAIAPLASLRYGAQIIVQALLAGASVLLLRDRIHIGRVCACAALSGGAGGAMMLLGIGRSDQYTRETLGEFANPNTTALALSVAAIAALVTISYTKSWFMRIVVLLTIPLSLAGMLKTGSRSSAVAIAIASVFGPLFASRAGFTRRFLLPAVIGGIGLVASVLIISSGIIGEQSRDRLVALFSGETESLQGESRFYIWKTAFTAFLTRPWGFGYGNTEFVMEQFANYRIDIHSTLFSALVDGGVISMAFFLAAIGHLFRSVQRIQNPNASAIGMIMFMFIVVSSLTHTVHFSKWFWIPLTICMLVVEQDARERDVAPQRGLPTAPLDPRAVRGRGQALPAR